jgi:BolA protein
VSEARVAAIRERLAVLAPLELDVEDESHRHVGHAGARDGRGHFRVRIVSAAFGSRRWRGIAPSMRHSAN